MSRYRTADYWLFGFLVFDEINLEEARVKANRGLTNLSGHPFPTQDPETEQWFCSYTQTSDGVPVAMTDGLNHNPSSLLKLIQR